MFLGAYLERMTGRKMHIWMGECHVHAGIGANEMRQAREDHPGAELLVHRSAAALARSCTPPSAASCPWPAC